MGAITSSSLSFSSFANTIFILAVIGSLAAFFVALSNPHKTKWRARRIFNTLLPQEVQTELRQLTNSWGESVRISKTQVHMLSFLGALIGAGCGLALFIIFGPGLGIILGGILILIGFMYPRQKYKQGFSRSVLDNLEREAPLLAGVMYQARGIAGFSVQKSFEKFMLSYPETQTTQILKGIPAGVSYTDALLGLELPPENVGNWIEVINTLSTINEMGNPTETLRILRDRIRAREVQQLKTLIKKKSFTAPAATVILILPGLMIILMGAIILQAIRSLSGSGVLP